MNNTLFNIFILFGIVVTLLTCILFVILVIKIGIRLINSFFRKHNRKKIIPRYSVIVFIVSGILTTIFLLNVIYNSNFIPRGYLFNTITSPYGNYEAKVYHYSGFVNYKNVRVEIVNNETQETKTIYYSYVDGPIHIEWIEEDRIKIENKLFYVEKDKYDFRND